MIKKPAMPKRSTFKSQIEASVRRTKQESLGYKKARENFSDLTESDPLTFDKKKYITKEYTDVEVHLSGGIGCEFQGLPAPYECDFLIRSYLKTSGKHSRLVISSIHNTRHEELGRTYFLIKKEALSNQLKKQIYKAYLEFTAENKIKPLSFKDFRADSFFIQEQSAVVKYLDPEIRYDLNYRERLKTSRTKDLKGILLDIEDKWGIKMRVVPNPGHSFDYRLGKFY